MCDITGFFWTWRLCGSTVLCNSYGLLVMYLNFGTPKMINFAFVPYGKLIISSVL